MDYRAAGAAVRRRREAKGWSRARLAEQAGISESAIKNLEAAQRPDGAPFKPSAWTLRSIAEAFGYPDGADLLLEYGEEAMARQFERDQMMKDLAPLDRLPEDLRVGVIRIEEMIVNLLLAARTA